MSSRQKTWRQNTLGFFLCIITARSRPPLWSSKIIGKYFVNFKWLANKRVSSSWRLSLDRVNSIKILMHDQEGQTRSFITALPLIKQTGEACLPSLYLPPSLLREPPHCEAHCKALKTMCYSIWQEMIQRLKYNETRSMQSFAPLNEINYLTWCNEFRPQNWATEVYLKCHKDKWAFCWLMYTLRFIRQEGAMTLTQVMFKEIHHLVEGLRW